MSITSKVQDWLKARAADALSKRIDIDEDGKVELDEALCVGAELGAVGLHAAADGLAVWAAAERLRLSGRAAKKWSSKPFEGA